MAFLKRERERELFLYSKVLTFVSVLAMQHSLQTTAVNKHQHETEESVY